ncbi:TolC family protein [Acidicapsa ligni]|uniref:TolC family protein n=1 Tax=Acidicapsa ligni TaxID=542300 RepID=UPI0021E0B821|nr:TolC family protein [Acidicapsa ligni]
MNKSQSIGLTTACVIRSMQRLSLVVLCIGFGLSSFTSALAISAQQVNDTTTQTPGAIQITLDEAIVRAKANEPNFNAAVAASHVAALDRTLARAALLPSVVYHNQYLYTQPAHGVTDSANASAATATSTPRFIGGNAVHEYTSQGVVTETIGLQQVTAVARASAATSVASAELEIARRGLVAAVVGLYYSSLSADRKLTVAKRAADEASNFTGLTQKREEAREVAHADVVKAQLQQQQRERDLADMTLQKEKARLDLAVLLFSDPHTPYTLLRSDSVAPLAQRAEIDAAATAHNPELASALASLRTSSLDVTAARAAYLPDLGLNFSYGIDAAQFAIHAPDGTRNLGYSAMATLDIPVWDWLSTHNRIRQKQSLRESARIALSDTQRKLIAQLDEFYAEARVANDQLHSLDVSVETARESLRLTLLRYTAGEANVLEVVDAQNSLTSTELAEEDGILRDQTALANLQILTGTL